MRAVVSLSLLFIVGTAIAAPEKRSNAKAKQVSRAPDGFVEMFVAGILITEGGPAVILRDETEKKLLPIWIGSAEAHAIQLRLDRRNFERPLTHDLLDRIMHDLGGTLVKIQVEDLRGDTYIGTMFVKRGDEIRHFDARPSDMIALALGNQAPIYVSEIVLKNANQLKEAPREIEPPEPGEPPAGLKTL